MVNQSILVLLLPLTSLAISIELQFVTDDLEAGLFFELVLVLMYRASFDREDLVTTETDDKVMVDMSVDLKRSLGSVLEIDLVHKFIGHEYIHGPVNCRKTDRTVFLTQ